MPVDPLTKAIRYARRKLVVIEAICGDTTRQIVRVRVNHQSFLIADTISPKWWARQLSHALGTALHEYTKHVNKKPRRKRGKGPAK